MLPSEDDKKVNLEPEETIAGRIKLNPQKRKIKGKELRLLTPKELLTRLPISGNWKQFIKSWKQFI